MAAPTTQFRNIPISTAETDLNTKTKRTSAISGESSVSTGAGNEWDFGTVDISGGANQSAVKMLFWNITANGGNTTADNFKIWLSSSGFDQAGTTLYMSSFGDGSTNSGLSFGDVGTNNDTQEYVANATLGTYNWTAFYESDPGALNVFCAEDDNSLDISTVPSDVVAVAAYLNVADNETTGTYKGTDTGYEFQGSFKFDYS